MRGIITINNRSKQFLSRIFLFAFMALPVVVQAIEIDTPKIALESVPFDIVISDATAGADVSLTIGGEVYGAVADDDGAVSFGDLVATTRGAIEVTVVSGDASVDKQLRVLPGWISLMPCVFSRSQSH